MLRNFHWCHSWCCFLGNGYISIARGLRSRWPQYTLQLLRRLLIKLNIETWYCPRSGRPRFVDWPGLPCPSASEIVKSLNICATLFIYFSQLFLMKNFAFFRNFRFKSVLSPFFFLLFFHQIMLLTFLEIYPFSVSVLESRSWTIVINRVGVTYQGWFESALLISLTFYLCFQVNFMMNKPTLILVAPYCS